MVYNVEKLGTINIGRHGENLARVIEIDVSSMLKQWPDATITLLVKRNKDEAPYVAVTELVDGILCWPVTRAETAVPGNGLIEIRATRGETIAKSVTGFIRVSAALTENETDPPETAKSWVDQVIEYGNKATQAAIKTKQEADRLSGINAKAVTLPEGSEATVTVEEGCLVYGIPRGDKGDKGNTGDVGPKGDTGDVGPQGPKGEQGIPGADGKDAVVDATLTQSGQAADAKTTGDALALKLTEPSTGLAVGKYFRIAAIDNSGHAVLEAVDLPIAANKHAGMVQVSDYDGWYMYGNLLQARTIDSANFASTNNTAIIGKGTLNSILSTPSVMPPLTAEEQAAARERMCVENGADFELLVDATLEEEVNTFTVVFPKPVRECIYHIWFYNNNNSSVTAQTKCLESNTSRYYLLKYTANINNGRGYALNGYFRYNGPISSRSIIGYASDSSAQLWTTDNPGNGNIAYISYPRETSLKKVDSLSFNLTNTSHVLNAGATIKVWGR